MNERVFPPEHARPGGKTPLSMHADEERENKMSTRHRLHITEADYQRIIRHVSVTADERMAFLYCGRTSADGRVDWLVRDVDLPDDGEYRKQGPARVSLKSEAFVGRVLRARGAVGFVDVHSHPFTDRPWPSGIDDRGAHVQLRVLGDLAPSTTVLRLIVGANGVLFGQVLAATEDAWQPIDEVVVLGRGLRRVVRPVNAATRRRPAVRDLDARTAVVVGPAVNDLRAVKVLVIGAGGVGSAVLAQLAGLVDLVGIVDPDVVEAHNLPRLWYASHDDVGRPKAEAAVAALEERFPALEACAHVGSFPDTRSEEMFRAADVVFCCPDHHAVRWAAASLAARTMRPLVEVGCGGRRGKDGGLSLLGYHVRFQVPGGPCLACNGLDLSRLEDPSSTMMKLKAGYMDGDDTVQGELVTLTTRAAADAVDVFVRYVTGYSGPARGHIYFDAVNLISLDLTNSHAPDPACTLCGEAAHALRAAGDDLGEEQRVLAPSREVADAAL